MAADIRVDAVGLIELGAGRDAVEQEGDEYGSILFGQSREERLKLARVVEAQLAGHLHPGEDETRLGYLARTLSKICCRLRRVTAGSIPRRPSLAPKAKTKISTGERSVQSMRRRPPADVSPLRPALTTRQLRSAGSAATFFSMSPG